MSRRVYLVEDHPVLRDAFTSLINATGDLCVVGSAASAAAALEGLMEVDTDVVLVDVSLGGARGTAHGIDLAGAIHRRWPDLRMLVVSGHDEGLYAERALCAGARGYLMKHEAGPGLIPAIRCVLAGEVALSDRMRGLLPGDLLTPVRAL
ncbi:MAG TPA: response regulator transcription factor [Rubricoccaceae bacterium]|jgi:DNA-binding NarL/FixJ family response regulator